MPAVNPSDRRGLGSNQYKDRPPRPIDQETATSNNDRAANAKNGIGQLAERAATDWNDEYARLARKQARMTQELDTVYDRMRTTEPMSDEYYDTLDKYEDMERDMEIVNQEVYEASIFAEGYTAADVAANLPKRINAQYTNINEALGLLDNENQNGDVAESLQKIEGSLTAASRDALFLNRKGLIKGHSINEFSDKARLRAAQIRRITTNGNLSDVTAVKNELTAIQTSVADLSETAQKITNSVRKPT